jgi:hypothetical protein
VTAAPDPPRFWADYSYLSGRRKPVAVTHCQSHHDEITAPRTDGSARNGYSVRLPPSARARCFTCGAVQVRPPVVCGYCRMRIYRVRNGEWYHTNNSSVSCSLGSGDGRKAFPAAVEA